jgi:hypothetical protein
MKTVCEKNKTMRKAQSFVEVEPFFLLVAFQILLMLPSKRFFQNIFMWFHKSDSILKLNQN